MKQGYCSHCNCKFTYYTQRDFIIHAPCKQKITVEPCEAEPEEPVNENEVTEDGADI